MKMRILMIKLLFISLARTENICNSCEWVQWQDETDLGLDSISW